MQAIQLEIIGHYQSGVLFQMQFLHLDRLLLSALVPSSLVRDLISTLCLMKLHLPIVIWMDAIITGVRTVYSLRTSIILVRFKLSTKEFIYRIRASQISIYILK